MKNLHRQSISSHRYSPIEDALSLHPRPDLGSDIYTNAHPLWTPPWAKGIFGGVMLAQSLAASQSTVSTSFTVHSMHCHFLRAGTGEVAIVYEVDRVRDGRNFVMRNVEAKQGGKCIFSATINFTRVGASSSRKLLEHTSLMPGGLTPPPDNIDAKYLAKAGQVGDDRVIDCVRGTVDNEKGKPAERKLRQWIRACGHISDDQAHPVALAYMSDNYFIGTVARVHNAARFSQPRYLTLADSLSGSQSEKTKIKGFFEDAAREEEEENGVSQDEKRIEMMVTLNHIIFFHSSGAFRADEWMLAEMDTPWAGNERGLVTQKIWSRDGTLIATCIQEGVVKLNQHKDHSKL